MAMKFEAWEPCAVCGARTRRGCFDNSHQGERPWHRAYCVDHRVYAEDSNGQPRGFLCEHHYNVYASDPTRYGPIRRGTDPGD